ncbi:MAG: sulfite exporter TauE/SafE family protein [Pirellulales bacterium]
MTPLILAVFIASIFGSLHCVGMCGPLAMLANGTREGKSAFRGTLWAYHGGRLLAYALLGAIAGTVGSGIHHTGLLLGAQRAATQLAGLSMLVIGLLSLVHLASGTQHMPWTPPWLQTRLAQGHAWARKQPPLQRAAMVGVLTSILPCGWLYAFLLVAAGTADPLFGSAVMFFFGLGSVPALSAIALGTTMILGRMRFAIPWCSALLVTVVGFFTLAHRSTIDLTALHHVKSTTSAQDLLRQVQLLEQQTLPCCEDSSEEN